VHDEACLLDAQQRSLRARLGAFTLRSRHNPRDYTAAARETFLSSFERLVDPDHRLPGDERRARAAAARSAHFARLALKSAQVRAARSHQRVRPHRSDGEA
jgi:hypothetical protein